MAFIEKCFCCSLPIACGFFAAYLLIAYLIAFAFELIWIILDSSNALPTAAVLLSAGYFALSLFAALLLHGLATKNSLCLVSWMFAVTILTFPEAGLAIYMSVDYWGTGHIYGITELSCWLFRIIVNVVQIVLIQSLYSLWKDEDTLEKRMQELTGTAFGGDSVSAINSQYYQNNGYEESVDQYDGNLKRYGPTPNVWNNVHMLPLPVSYGGYQLTTTTSEFNASVFMPGYENGEMPEKKAQSLMDLRFLDHPGNMTYAQQWISGSMNDSSSMIVPPSVYAEKQAPPRAMSEINYSTLPSKLSRCKSAQTLDGNNQQGNHIIRNRSGFYAQPMENYGVPIYYGPLDGPDFLIYKKKMERLNSRNSLSNTSADEISKYRDVAL